MDGDGHHARRGDDGAANSFVLDLGKSAGSTGTVPANKSKRIAIGLQQRLEVLAPGAIDGTIVGDRVAHGHDLQEVGRAEVGQDQVAAGREPGAQR